jgi:hypothetical protein
MMDAISAMGRLPQPRAVIPQVQFPYCEAQNDECILSKLRNDVPVGNDVQPLAAFTTPNPKLQTPNELRNLHNP